MDETERPPEGGAAGKRRLRHELLTLRRALLPADVAHASAEVAARLRALAALAGESSVLLYASDPDEVSLDELIDRPPPGWKVLLPRVEDDRIVAVEHRAGDPLVAGHRGLREPTGPPVDPGGIDAVVVPGVAFTAEGDRLGRGAGMYDRLLAELPDVMRVGVCMEAFLMSELPTEEHDARMDIVVTDASVRRRTSPADVGPA